MNIISLDNGEHMSKANSYLHSLPRINSIEQADFYSGDVLLFPKEADFIFTDDNLVQTIGLGEKIDKKIRDLLRIIKVEDALNIQYKQTNVLSPLMYAESLSNIPWHMNTQGILFTKVTNRGIDWIKEEIKNCQYGKHDVDQFWLPFSRSINEIEQGDVLCIFNRRVGGWDGSPERPVIELLGAGGHLPVVWNEESDELQPLNFKENIEKEFFEELGMHIDEKNIAIFGGYKNEITHELVVLSGIEVSEDILPKIQSFAVDNIEEDSMGIYLGTFEEVIQYYRMRPEPFAGGARTAPYNFPNRLELMSRAINYSKLGKIN